jgi:hypothetical protein
MSYLNKFYTALGSTQYVKFYDPANPSNSYTCNVNPTQMPRKASSVRKYVETTGGTSTIFGGREYPTKEIGLNWNVLDYNEFLLMSAFTGISPVVMVDNNNNGYLGVFCIDQVEQLLVTTKAVRVQASFLVLAPYNGIESPINALTPPTLTATLDANPGYIPNATDIYIWPTVFTPFGESEVGDVLHILSTGANQGYDISFTAPTSLYYKKTRLYWNSTNDPTSATFLSDVQAGFPVVGTTAFIVWTGYIPYNLETPPTYGTAFTGYFAGGLWVQTT